MEQTTFHVKNVNPGPVPSDEADGNARVIEQVKSIITGAIYAREAAHVDWPSRIAGQAGLDYPAANALFVSVEGLTLEKYIALQRIERAKELLVYDRLSLGQIALQLGYGSARRLAGQFKRATGLAPSFFKKLRVNKSLYGDVHAH